LGIMAPDGSVTWPVMEPWLFCAEANGTNGAIRRRTRKRQRFMQRLHQQRLRAEVYFFSEPTIETAFFGVKTVLEASAIDFANSDNSFQNALVRVELLILPVKWRRKAIL
jgi:hypothetical protein